jgi:hypothetical protein
MNALMKALLAAGGRGKTLASEVGNIAKGGKEIAMGGNGAVMGQGGKMGAIKQLLSANKGGAGAIGAGALGAGYGLSEAMGDEEGDEEDEDGLLKRLGIG